MEENKTKLTFEWYIDGQGREREPTIDEKVVSIKEKIITLVRELRAKKKNTADDNEDSECGDELVLERELSYKDFYQEVRLRTY